MADALDRYIAERDQRSPGFAVMVDAQLQTIKAFDDFVNRLADRLGDLGMSRAELARRMEMAPSNLSRLLNDDEANPTLETLTRLADAIDCDLQLVPRAS